MVGGLWLLIFLLLFYFKFFRVGIVYILEGINSRDFFFLGGYDKGVFRWW